MPRRIDYTQGNETDWNEVRLPEPRYGKNEIVTENYNELAAATYPAACAFWPQFSTYGNRDPENRAQVMDEAHQWLSENTTGPWYWSEDWTNHGHHIDTTIYVEREPDQRAFQSAFGHVFKFDESSDYELRQVATLRGVFPLLTPKESFLVWEHKNKGFKEEVLNDKLKPALVRITFELAAMEEKFVADWGDVFRADPFVPHAYLGSFQTGDRRSDDPKQQRDTALWLSRHSAFGSGGGEKTEDGYKFFFETRYDEARAAVEQDWGHVFTWSEKRSRFEADEYPSSPEREIPEDFKAYLRGDRENYAAPYLAALLPERREQKAGTAAVPKSSGPA